MCEPFEDSSCIHTRGGVLQDSGTADFRQCLGGKRYIGSIPHLRGKTAFIRTCVGNLGRARPRTAALGPTSCGRGGAATGITSHLAQARIHAPWDLHRGR